MIHRFFTLPHFHESEKSIQARLLQIIIWYTLFVGFVLSAILVNTDTVQLPDLAMVICMAILLAICWILLQRGSLNLSAQIYLMGIWLALTYTAAYLPLTAESPILSAYLVLSLLAGILLGRVAATIQLTFSLLAYLGLYAASQAGLLPYPILSLTPLQAIFLHGLNFFVAALIINGIVNIQESIRHRFQQVQQDLVDKNRELQDAQTSLELRVAMRTVEILRQKQFYEALVLYSPVAIATMDMNNIIDSCNPAFEELFGYQQLEVIGQHIDDLITTPASRPEAVALTKQTDTGETVHRISQRQHKNGHLIDVEIFGVPVFVGQKQVGVLALYHDISERKATENYLKHLATHDPLTNLPNRSLFYDRLNHALLLSKRANLQVAVLFLDLDGFKSINDLFGHEVGDQLLQGVASRLTGCLRSCDTVARLGGDEFAFVFENISDAEAAEVIAQKILRVLSEPFIVENQLITIGGSLGISLAPADALGAEAIIRCADTAMYHAKENGKNSYRFFNPRESVPISTKWLEASTIDTIIPD